nr:MAG TPA: hypothetical protein [Microviridae sp.]
MEKKRFYKVIRAFKHNGEICEFSFTLPHTFDEAYALAVDSTDYFVWNLIALVLVEPTCSFAAKSGATIIGVFPEYLYSLKAFKYE